MPTNEEREEAAAWFRLLEGKLLQYEQMYGEGEYTRSSILGDIEKATNFSASGAKTIYGRLADLIKPESERTCHDYGGQEGTNGEMYDFACDECGFACDTPQPDYCPGCGAKVIY